MLITLDGSPYFGGGKSMIAQFAEGNTALLFKWASCAFWWAS